jgi:hypothetical protein
MYAKVYRELSFVENIPKDPPKLKNLVTIVVKYTADFVFEVELKPDNFDIVSAHNDFILGPFQSTPLLFKFLTLRERIFKKT